MATSDGAKLLENIVKITQSSIAKQIFFMAGIGLSVTLGIYLYASMKDPMYRPLDYKMDDKNAAMIADTLDKAHIPYKFNDSDGLVLVPAKDVQAAKYKLASAGIQKDDTMNFSYLNDQNAIGESQFLENARYLRALEGDLAKTIIAIDGVSSARVHIAMPQNTVFADETGKPTASVFITVGSGTMTDKEKIRSIVEIVASSVPGLDPKDVAITDQYGHYLSDSLSAASLENAQQMKYQSTIQEYYEKRIESLITPLLGSNKISVRVHADMDFSQQEEANEKYDPDTKAIRSEETTSEQTSSASATGAAGALANSPPATPTAGGSGTSSGGTGRNSSIKNYEVSKSVTYKKSNIAKMNSISVAVVLDNDTVIDPKTKKVTSTPLDKDKLAKINDLVKATIGYDQKRGDVVTVVNSSFSTIADDTPIDPTHFWMEAWFWEIVKKVASLGFVFIIFMLLYKKLMNHVKDINTNKGGMAMGATDEDSLSPEMHQLKQEQINRLKEVASKDPSRVALVIKNWVIEK